MSLQAYLASKYLNADPSSTKKRKRKHAKDSSAGGLIIADDDDSLGFSRSSNNDDEFDGPVTVSGARGVGTFRAAKKSSWKTVGAPAPTDSEQAAADAIIADTAAENAAAFADGEDAPIVEGQDDDAMEGVIKLSDGTHAGLQTAADVAAQQAAHKRREMAAWEKESGGKKKGKDAEETVYRDATGRRIDISMRRAQMRAEAEEAEKKERERKEGLKGDVQRAEAARRKEKLDEARFLPLARHADDEEMNQELKERDRWNDPAAMFLSKKKSEDGGGSSRSGAVKGGKKEIKPVYKGAAPPNRYGIRPGYRWDGVDRGNGWEAERFKALNRRERNKGLEYSWQLDE